MNFLPIIIVLAASFACTPKGKMPERPKSYTSLKDGATQPGGSQKGTPLPQKTTQLNFFQEGLPGFCSFARASETKACITCKPEELSIERCFKVGAKFDVKRSCTHDRSKLKCLVPDSLAVVKVSFYSSNEKEFLQNLPVVISTIKMIASNNLDAKSKDSTLFFAVLDFVDVNATNILTNQKSDELARDLRRLFEANGQAESARLVEQAYLDGIRTLQSETRSGKLDIVDGLKFMSGIIQKFSTNAEIVRLIDTINLEGLINTNG